MIVDTAAALAERFGTGGPIVTARAPGRVNLIGEHTDYNGGFVLPTPIGRFNEVSVRVRDDDQVRLYAVDTQETFEEVLGADATSMLGGWRNYVWGLAEELRLNGHVTGGFELALGGSIPAGAGLSSSAALEVATGLALERAFGFELEPLEMVRICRDVEHRWAGVRCGIMDQMACRLGRPREALFIDCRDETYRAVPLDLGSHTFVIIFSGVRRELMNTAYNRRRYECEESVVHLARRAPQVRSLRDVDEGILADCGGRLAPEIQARCRHVVTENARVPAAVAALEAGDLPAFGELMNASHASLRDDFAASHPVIDALISEILDVPEVLGARLTGAGFGGSIVVLSHILAVPQIFKRMEVQFAVRDVRGQMLMAGPATAAGVLEDGN